MDSAGKPVKRRPKNEADVESNEDDLVDPVVNLLIDDLEEVVRSGKVKPKPKGWSFDATGWEAMIAKNIGYIIANMSKWRIIVHVRCPTRPPPARAARPPPARAARPPPARPPPARSARPPPARAARPPPARAARPPPVSKGGCASLNNAREKVQRARTIPFGRPPRPAFSCHPVCLRFRGGPPRPGYPPRPVGGPRQTVSSWMES